MTNNDIADVYAAARLAIYEELLAAERNLREPDTLVINPRLLEPTTQGSEWLRAALGMPYVSRDTIAPVTAQQLRERVDRAHREPPMGLP